MSSLFFKFKVILLLLCQSTMCTMCMLPYLYLYCAVLVNANILLLF